MNDLEKCFVIKYRDVEFINALTKEEAITHDITLTFMVIK